MTAALAVGRFWLRRWLRTLPNYYLFLAINIVGKVRDHLTAIVTNGKLAQAELKELAQTAERRKRFGIV